MPDFTRICVIGGGPAGLAAAIALAREGAEVTVFDHAAPPIDKSCGEGLMPDSIEALRALGVELPPHLGFAFTGIRFSNSRSTVAAAFPAGLGRGIRRTALHRLLVARALELNISLVWGVKRIALDPIGVIADGRSIAADFVIGADGHNSRIRAQAGLEHTVAERRRYGFRRHYRIAPWSSTVELHWGPNCQVYITPVASDEVCVALISRDHRLRLDQALPAFPHLQERLAAAPPVTPELGALTVSRKLRRVHSRRVALVGDASGSVDAITGQGMCLAFDQACALAAALKHGSIQDYESEHRRLMRRPRFMASLLLTLSEHHRLQQNAIAGLARTSALFQSLVAFHVGARPALQFARPLKNASC